nr:amino acid adenylation domain-containing protein [Nostoc sp. EkiNYC01]
MNSQNQVLSTKNIVQPTNFFIEFPKQEIEQSIASRFLKQVISYPDNIAVKSRIYEWTYKDLDKRANQIAQRVVIALGVEKQRIALLFEHNAPMIAATLGVLKLGKTYVPLDRAFPKERLSYMLSDSAAAAILTNSQNLEFAKSLIKHDLPIINIDEISFCNEDFNKSQILATSEDIAYILYTSGSTGKPKGVMQSNRNVLHHMRTWTNSLRINSEDKLTLFSSYSWDSSVQDIFGALLNGACVSPLDVKHEGLENMCKWLIDQKITIYHSTVPLYRHLVKILTGKENFSKLRLLILGGDIIHKGDIEFYKKYFTDETIIVNAYGSTESTTCLQYFVNKETNLTQNVIPAGYVVEDTEVLLLNDEGEQVKVGEIGELVVKSAYVALGYWQQPDATAMKFQVDPSDINKKNYRMGDLGYVQPDGSIALAGRKDFQTKIRGFRVELGEIEATLSQHPKVQEAVVVVWEDTPSEKRLVAYIVLDQKQTFAISELRSFLNKKLPDYLIPSSFTVIDKLPLTPNHKIDRRALPAPGLSRTSLEKEYVAPRTLIEESIASIWAELLNVDRVGIYDNFLDLGGDSLIGFQVIVRAKRAGILLTIRQLRKYPTIAELGAVVEKNSLTQVDQSLVLGLVPLTPVKYWVFEQKFADLHQWSQSILLDVKESLNLDFLEKSLQHILIHHDALRIRFSQKDLRWQQFITSPEESKLSLEVVDLSFLQQEEQIQAFNEAAFRLRRSLNLIEGPLLKAVFFDLGKSGSGKILLTFHQTLVDGVSWRILLEDVQTIYKDLSQGRTMQLPPKTTSFKSWAEKLQDYAKYSSIKPELEYWEEVLTNPIKRLPVRYPNSNEELALTEDISTLLNVKETQILLQAVSKVYGARIDTVLLTAMVKSFSEWTGDRTLWVDLIGHGRESIIEDVDLSRTVGWFTTLCPVFLNINQADSLEDELKLIQKELQRIPNQGISYGLLRFLHGDSKVAEKMKNIQAEVSFNYLGQFDQVLPTSSSLFQLASESSQIVRGRPSHPLEITATVIGGQLYLDWTYSVKVYQESVVKELSQNFLKVIRSMIAYSQSIVSN